MNVEELMVAIGTQLETIADEIPGLQVVPYLNTIPTPPSLDVYPGDPFMTGAGFGLGQSQVFFTVRCRVSTADQEAGQKLLLRMLDPSDLASVEAALEDVAAVVPEGVSGFREYVEDSATGGRLLGCEWRVTAFLEPTPVEVTPPVEPLAPLITSLSPNPVSRGSMPVTLHVFGENFNSNCEISMTGHGGDLPTTFVSAGELTASLLAANFLVVGGVPVRVSDYTADLYSDNVTLTVT